MRNASLLVVLLLAGVSVPAQDKVAGSPTIFLVPPTSNACPVGFTAERRSSHELEFVNGGLSKSRQWVHLTFGRGDAQTIVKVSVTAHGASDKPHAMPASAGIDEDITETFQFERKSGEPGLLASNLSTHTMGSVRWVELTELDYADGSVWRESKASQCRATPSGFLLVAASQ